VVSGGAEGSSAGVLEPTNAEGKGERWRRNWTEGWKRGNGYGAREGDCHKYPLEFGYRRSGVAFA
jgi:hypothetical protein